MPVAENRLARGRQPAINPKIDRRVASNLMMISDNSRRNKIHMMAESGAGKSRWLGRVLAWQLLIRGKPQIIIDPTGGTIANLFDKIIRLPGEYQKRLWGRVKYVDMSGKGGYVMPFPLYHQLSPYDSLYDISQRFLEVIKRMDVSLGQAPILGLNAIVTLGTYTGMILTALDCQITEAPALIRNPEEWMPRIEYELQTLPELYPAVEFYRDYTGWKPAERSRFANSFMAKILPFIADPAMRAMFGAPHPAIDWQHVVNKGQTVCLDYSREFNPDRRRFKILWCFQSIIDFFKLRGFQGRNNPVSFIIDEVTQLLGYSSQENSVMAADIEELVSVLARNYGIDLTIAHQNLPQIGSERIQKALMTMGTQMIGVQTDPISAQLLANYFIRYDPYWVKRMERVWGSVMQFPRVIDHRPVDFTYEEQTLLNSYKFMDLKKFRFIVRAPQEEGQLGAKIKRISIERLDQDIYPDDYWVNRACQLLMERKGLPTDKVLEEINERGQITRAELSPVKKKKLEPVPSLWGQ